MKKSKIFLGVVGALLVLQTSIALADSFSTVTGTGHRFSGSNNSTNPPTSNPYCTVSTYAESGSTSTLVIPYLHGNPDPNTTQRFSGNGTWRVVGGAFSASAVRQFRSGHVNVDYGVTTSENLVSWV